MKNKRRSTLKRMFASVATVFGASTLGVQTAKAASSSKKVFNVYKDEQDVPLFSGSVVHGDTVYIAGKGAHFDGDIAAHTDHVLKELEKELEKAGSSMEKVLKVNVYLHDIRDYTAMNEVYKGRFGPNPPVRTTVAVFGGVPGDSLVEIDCIASL
ncbi:MAG: RidA family protein [Tunicatimonas sp.]|uniref:RidA family protein n=1 Tax=Tunicatimonas sp. TaxID=1940096 RepID=UPI003C76189F